MKLSLVIPAHNEEERLGPTLESYLAHFTEKYGEAYELIVVVNASTDGTEDLVRDFAKRHSQVKLIVEPRAVGKGGAVMQGWAMATGELMGFVDADGATPVEAFQDLIDHRGEAGAIIASRWHRDSKVSPPQPFKRRVSSRIFNSIVQFLFRLKLSDTQCGAKLFTAEAIQSVLPKLGLTKWAFDVDLLFKLRMAEQQIIEWPTTWRDVEGSKVNFTRAPVEMLVAICRLRMLESPLKWIVDIYDRTLGTIVHRNWS